MNDKVVVLMSTYNGEKYLKTQLDSLLNQSNVNVEILIRDDGSTDNTRKILSEYQSMGKLNWYSGKNLKPAKSFMDLVYNSPKCQYYAFCDQDDYWDKDKLSVAIEKIKKENQEQPILYYGRPSIVDKDLNYIKKSKVKKRIKFGEAIINSDCVGCTMVFNDRLMNLARERKAEYYYMHDLWIHKLCIIAKGILIFDKDVHIKYRQHGENVIGENLTRKERNKKRLLSYKNKPCERSKVIKSLYETYSYIMDEKTKRMCNCVINYKKNIFTRLKLAFNFNIRTKSFMANIYFILAVLSNSF